MPKQHKKLGRARARKRRKKQKKRPGPPSAIFLVVLLIVSSVVFLKYDVVSLGMNRIIKTGNIKELRSGLYTLKNRILNFQIGRDKATKQPASFVHAWPTCTPCDASFVSVRVGKAPSPGPTGAAALAACGTALQAALDCMDFSFGPYSERSDAMPVRSVLPMASWPAHAPQSGVLL